MLTDKIAITRQGDHLTLVFSNYVMGSLHGGEAVTGQVSLTVRTFGGHGEAVEAALTELVSARAESGQALCPYRDIIGGIHDKRVDYLGAAFVLK